MREFVELIMGITGYAAPQVNRPLSEVACIAQMMYDPNKKIPMMTPVLLDSQALAKANVSAVDKKLEDILGRPKSGHQMHGRMYFPPNTGFKANYKVTVVSNKVHVIEPKTLLDDHRVKNIDVFDPNKISKIADFVKKQGTLSFRIEDPVAAKKFMKGVNCFAKHYSHTVYYGHHHPGNGSPRGSCVDDILVLYVNFLDLPFAIPIYNRRKVDGMGIKIGMYWPASSQKTGGMYASDEIYLGVNRYATNLHVVDGVTINNRGYIGSEYVSHFCKQLDVEIQRRKDLPKLIKKAKENAKKMQSEANKMKGQPKSKPSRRSGGMTAIKLDTSGTSNWGATSSSSTTGTYYTTS